MAFLAPLIGWATSRPSVARDCRMAESDVEARQENLNFCHDFSWPSWTSAGFQLFPPSMLTLTDATPWRAQAHPQISTALTWEICAFRSGDTITDSGATSHTGIVPPCGFSSLGCT